MVKELDGEFIREWDCITDVERELNITTIYNNLKDIVNHLVDTYGI